MVAILSQLHVSKWNDGSNTLAVDPGKICVYQRNTVTNDVLYKEGMELLVVPSAELSRGRGGQRCMSMPFWREELSGNITIFETAPPGRGAGLVRIWMHVHPQRPDSTDVLI